jgi:hypothetical protein
LITLKFLWRMDNLRSLMRCLDDISKMIPEGTYLEMCDNIKVVHDNLPKHTDPPVRDNRSPQVNAPFQVVQPGVDVHRIVNLPSDTESDSGVESDDEPWQPEWYDEWSQNEDGLRVLLADLKVTKLSLRTLKPIQRNTEKVRVAAMRYFTAHTPILDMDIFEETEADEATFENYVRIANWANFSLADRKNFTSKKFEREIYDNYKITENHRIQRLTCEARELKRNLEIEIDEVRQRQDYLRAHYNL